MTWLGPAQFAGIPPVVFLFLLVAVIVGVFLKHHRYGRTLYAIGCNEGAALAAGLMSIA